LQNFWFAIPEGGRDAYPHKVTKWHYFTETHLLPTYHSVVLDVHVFQTKVEFVALQLLHAAHFTIKIFLYLLVPNLLYYYFFLVKVE
jgi:hypothetical protein